ncbi:MAG TPA: beta-N-acetylhexosaminidase [Burkholderiaceae bacterium]|nr:beta-N-acetylhexosaminidase [Burkholderiaceae bacterium]
MSDLKSNASTLSQTALLPGPIMVDVDGHVLTAHEVERLRHPLVGGAILFARNFASRRQLADLCEAIHAVREQPLIIAVDHEGGRVQRFRTDGFTRIPAMQALGEKWADDPWQAQRLATDAAWIMATELRACGVDLAFAPVLDLDYGVSDVIGSRALHADPAVVTTLARALCHGLALAGMAACGKHFPGHGAVAADSHHAMPRDPRSLAQILEADAAPYAWLGDLVLPAVMPAHVVYPEVDSQPAGFSTVWLQQVLRQKLQYNGVIFTDDLTMEAATVAGDIVSRTQAALKAGCDMALVCNRPDLADDLLARLDYQPDAASGQRIARLKPALPARSWADLQALETYQHARQRLRSENLSD